MQNEFKHEWAQGTYTAENPNATIQLNTHALGKVQMLQDIIELEYEMVAGEENG